MFFPGETEVLYYVRGLPDDVTLTDHEPIIKPWILLSNITSAPLLTAIDVYSYNTVALYNASDDVAMVVANTDDDNAYAVMPGAKEVWDNSGRLFGCLNIESMGSGTIYIYGLQ